MTKKEKEKKVSKFQKGYGEGFSMGMEAGLLIVDEFCIGLIEKLREERKENEV